MSCLLIKQAQEYSASDLECAIEDVPQMFVSWVILAQQTYQTFLSIWKTLYALKLHRIDNIKQCEFYKCLRHAQLKMAARN